METRVKVNTGKKSILTIFGGSVLTYFFFVLFSINVKMFYFDFFFKETAKIEYVLDIFHPK